MKRILFFIMVITLIFTTTYTPSINAANSNTLESAKTQTFKKIGSDYLIARNNDLYFLKKEGNYNDYELRPVKVLLNVEKYVEHGYPPYAVTTKKSLHLFNKPPKVYSNAKEIIRKFNAGEIGTKKQYYVIKTDNSLWETELNSFNLKNKLITNVKNVYEKYEMYETYEDGEDETTFYRNINTFIFKNDNSLWARGTNKNGELGLGDTKSRTKFVKIMTDVVKLEYPYVLKKDKSVWTWSKNKKPHKILSNIKSVDYFYNSYLHALDINGRLSKVTSKKSIVFATNVKKYGAEFMIKNDDSLWTWGWLCGDGTKDVRTKPIKVLTNVYNYFKFESAFKALKKDDTLWTWGSNYDYQLGGDFEDYRLKPIKVYSNVKQVLQHGTLFNNGDYHYTYALREETTNAVKHIPTTIKVSEDVKHVYEFNNADYTYFTKNNESGIWKYDKYTHKIQKFF